MKRMLITVPEGIQPSEVGHHGSVESNCGRDPPFNEDFYKSSLMLKTQTKINTRRCTTVRDSEGQAIPCNGGSDGSVWVMGKWSMQWVSG